VHKIHVLMAVNVHRMVLADSHVVVQIHLLVNVAKIVSSYNYMKCSYYHNCFSSGINPCASQPCRNGGTCQPLNMNSYQCICPPGYSGYDCSTRKFLMLRKNEKQEWWISMLLGDPCADNPCLNGASCIPNSSGGFTCQCPPGYSGQRCEDRKNINIS
jgi:hypothetical protein